MSVPSQNAKLVVSLVSKRTGKKINYLISAEGFVSICNSAAVLCCIVTGGYQTVCVKTTPVKIKPAKPY